MSILMTHSFQTEFLRCIDVVEAGRYPYTGQLGILSEQDHEKVAEALRLVHGEELAHQRWTTATHSSGESNLSRGGDFDFR